MTAKVSLVALKLDPNLGFQEPNECRCVASAQRLLQCTCMSGGRGFFFFLQLISFFLQLANLPLLLIPIPASAPADATLPHSYQMGNLYAIKPFVCKC